MVTVILDNIGSGNDFLPDGTKPLPEPMLTYPCHGLIKNTKVCHGEIGIMLYVNYVTIYVLEFSCDK